MDSGAAWARLAYIGSCAMPVGLIFASLRGAALLGFLQALLSLLGLATAADSCYSQLYRPGLLEDPRRSANGLSANLQTANFQTT